MSDDDRPLTRKTRRKLDRAARDRLIAEIAGTTSEATAGTTTADADPPEDLPDPAPDVVPAEDDGAARPAGPDETPPDETAIPTEPAPEPIRVMDQQDQQEQVSSPPDNTPEPPPPPAPAPSAPEPEPALAPDTASMPEPGRSWPHLATIPVDAEQLERNLIITATRHDPAHGAFDVLRTRLVQTLFDHGWKRVAITSPTRDCGKTFTAVNLAISLSRYETHRTILMDMDMRNPSIASVLGVDDPGNMGDFLQGQTGVTDLFKRLGRNTLNIGRNLAVAMNDRVEPYAAELLQGPETADALARMMDELDPDIVLFDLPPALAFDDVIAFKGQFDGVLMVVGGGQTKPDEVHEAMRRLGEDVPLLGVVLNQAEDDDALGYSYGY